MTDCMESPCLRGWTGSGGLNQSISNIYRRRGIRLIGRVDSMNAFLIGGCKGVKWPSRDGPWYPWISQPHALIEESSYTRGGVKVYRGNHPNMKSYSRKCFAPTANMLREWSSRLNKMPQWTPNKRMHPPKNSCAILCRWFITFCSVSSRSQDDIHNPVLLLL